MDFFLNRFVIANKISLRMGCTIILALYQLFLQVVGGAIGWCQNLGERTAEGHKRTDNVIFRSRFAAQRIFFIVDLLIIFVLHPKIGVWMQQNRKKFEKKSWGLNNWAALF